ncbi:MAG: hypothetical protein CMJ27_14375 [Phycisphaerae bacterium]|nr:hypothetical protein [Phycisphaerae bacterium]MAH67530.1 hypothetical protein [Phycisphaerae bacterium]OUW99709.1 MAG: hypothetical protein CBD91_08340 [Phycisphaeraceae bacterium TMED231]OUW99923.1 MAG: hypothetical protein CBD91_07890 [Phycisphaeraceae bacterium TMED231]
MDSPNSNAEEHVDGDRATEIEAVTAALTATWSTVLGTDPETEPDFKRATGTSLDLIDIQVRLHRSHSLVLDLDKVTEPVTFQSLVACIRRADDEDEGAISSGMDSDAAASSSESAASAAQIEQWIAERVNPKGREYLIGIRLDSLPDVTWAGLDRACLSVLDVHPALRTSVHALDSGKDLSFVQRVHPTPMTSGLVIRPKIDGEGDELQTLLDLESIEPPRVEGSIMMRPVAFTRDGGLDSLVLVFHHVAVDDQSLGIIVDDLREAIGGSMPGAEDRSFIEWSERRSDSKDGDVEWWQERLVDVPVELDLPVVDSIPRSSTRSREVTARIPREMTTRIDRRLKIEGDTRSGVAVNAFKETLFELDLARDDRVSIATPMSLRDHPLVSRTVGMFLNTLPVVLGRNDDCKAASNALWETRRHRNLPFLKIIDTVPRTKNASRAPWLDACMGIMERSGADESSWAPLFSGATAFPILVMTRWSDSEIEVTCQVQERHGGAKLATEIIENLIDRIQRHAISGVDRSSSVSELRSEVPVGERRPRNVVEIVEEVANRSPENVAIESANGDRSVDHSMLSRMSRGLGRRLQDAGAERGRPVGILLESSVELSIAVLAAMRIGGVAMPMPPSTPAHRLRQMLRLAGAKTIVLPRNAPVPGFLETDGVSVVHPDRSDESISDHGDPCEVAAITGEEPAYLLFTSGSTGEPKGVLVSHATLANLVDYEVRRAPKTGSGRCTQFASVGFDVSLQEIFSTWSRGETLVPVPTAVRRDPAEFAAFLEDRRISRVYLPPLLARAVFANSGTPSALEEIVCAGEALRIDDGMRKACRGRPFNLVNQYGPTETHVATSVDLGRDPEAWSDLPGIGHPIDGVVIRIEDASGELVPLGRSGEIVIGGVAVGIGYLEDGQGGFEDRADGRWYRTGDVGRVEDGISFQGRDDDQVKVSGFRVEPREIEVGIAGVPGVEDAAVVAVKGADGVSLRGFYVADQSISAVMVTEALSLELPDWMIPRDLTPLGVIPRSANGKVDRARLRELPVSDVTHRDHAEFSERDLEVMAELHALVPEISDLRCGANQTLGNAGIDSLGAIRLQSILQRRFELAVSVTGLLEKTAEDVLADVRRFGDPDRSSASARGMTPPDQRNDAGSPASDAGSASEWRPLAPIVRDILAKEAMSDPGIFHLAWRIQRSRPFDRELIRDDIEIAVRSWPTLRNRWSPSKGVRTVSADTAPKVDIHFFDSDPGPEVVQSLVIHPMDLELQAPIRGVAWPSPDGGTTLILIVHHIAADGVLAREMIDWLLLPEESRAARLPDSEPVEVDERSDPGSVQWWVNRLESSLGGQRLPQPPERDRRAAMLESASMAVDSSMNDRLVQYQRDHAHGRVAVATVAWAIAVGRSLEKDTVVLGVPFATSSGQGIAASVLPVVVRLKDALVVSLVDQVRDQIREGIIHRNASMSEIISGLHGEDDHSRAPFDGVLTIDDLRRISSDGSSVEWIPMPRSAFQCSAVLPTNEGLGTLGISAEQGFLQGESASSMLERWSHLIDQILSSVMLYRDSNRVDDIDHLTPGMRSRLAEFSKGDAWVSKDADVPTRFAKVVREHGTRVAVTDGTSEVSYRELDHWSDEVAAGLLSVGVQPGDPVVIESTRGIPTIAGLLGIVKAGGWFVPIDLDLPRSVRVNQMRRSRSRFGVGSPGFAEQLELKGRCVDPESREAVPGDAPARHVARDVSAPLYGLFTSGTTGTPRCVVVPHRAVLRLVDDPFFIRLEPGARMLHAAPLAFDASTIEIWGPLLNGATVCCWTGLSADLGGLADFKRRVEFDRCWLTSALFNTCIDSIPRFFQGMNTVMTGGDVVSPRHVARLQERFTGTMLVNGYGPTENTVFTACEVIPAGSVFRDEFVPVGRPIRGTDIDIVDDRGRLVPPGRIGEIVASGAGVGLGYLDDVGVPRATGGFVARSEGEIRYRTGDLAAWSTDGRLRFIGRRDSQVKISGHRVELSAIDQAFRNVPGIEDASTCVMRMGERSMIGTAVVALDRSEFDEVAVRDALSSRLPEWEIPSRIVLIEEIPVTKNGKPDRQATSSILASRVDEPTLVDAPSGSKIEAIIVEVASGMIAPHKVDARRPLRTQGFDSLDLLRLSLELEKVLSRPVDVGDVLQDSSVVGIAKRIGEDLKRESEPIVALRRGSTSCRASVFCIPGVGGTVFSFNSILDTMPNWCPVWGLPYPGISGESKPARRVEELVDRFLAAAADHVPQNPVLLGYSFGAFIAFEMARKLKERGVDPVVVVIDAVPASLDRFEPRTRKIKIPKDWKLRMEHVFPKAIADAMGLKRSRSMKHLRDVIAGSFEAMRNYAPVPLDHPVHLLKTRETDFANFASEGTLGWSTLASDVRITELPGNHLEVFRVGAIDLGTTVSRIVQAGRAGL